MVTHEEIFLQTPSHLQKTRTQMSTLEINVITKLLQNYKSMKIQYDTNTIFCLQEYIFIFELYESVYVKDCHSFT